LGQRNVGHEAAVAANERVVFEARFVAGATFYFCIHGLFSNALLCGGRAPYKRNYRVLKEPCPAGVPGRFASAGVY
jgi:hypothetical protein